MYRQSLVLRKLQTHRKLNSNESTLIIRFIDARRRFDTNISNILRLTFFNSMHDTFIQSEEARENEIRQLSNFMTTPQLKLAASEFVLPFTSSTHQSFTNLSQLYALEICFRIFTEREFRFAFRVRFQENFRRLVVAKILTLRDRLSTSKRSPDPQQRLTM